ncbi:hypothetical protein ABK040_007845 [Willaertia magna]
MSSYDSFSSDEIGLVHKSGEEDYNEAFSDLTSVSAKETSNGKLLREIRQIHTSINNLAKEIREAREEDRKAREEDRKAREEDRKAREEDRKAREEDRALLICLVEKLVQK